LTSVEHVLVLTQAVDEFESVSLAASLRRAERIARLRGDIHYAHMFQLDLRPNGGSTTWSRTEAYELLKSEEISDVHVDVWRSQIFEEWIKERVPSERHRRRMESFLSRISPRVLEQFTAAYRRARRGACLPRGVGPKAAPSRCRLFRGTLSRTSGRGLGQSRMSVSSGEW
jgi:hypothetical protein